MALLKEGYLFSSVVGILGSCVVLAIWKVYRAISSPLRKVPGPFLARFSRLWYFRHVYNGDYHMTDVELHRKYGMLFS